jgi:hypothetical protein
MFELCVPRHSAAVPDQQDAQSYPREDGKVPMRPLSSCVESVGFIFGG